MLLSLALIFLCGLLLGSIFQKIRLPSLIGMLLTGMILGPYVLDLLSPNILAISADLRQIALIIILTRAGLALDIKELKKVGRPAILMCFIPALFEITGMMLLAPRLLGISLLEAAIMGAVVAAVSPAVIVPKMLKALDEGYGTKKSIPQLLLAGSSADDIFVIVLFTAIMSVSKGGHISAISALAIPISIVLGLTAGIVLGIALAIFFNKVHIRDSGKVVILLSISFLLVTLEHSVKGAIGFSGLLAVMAMGVTLQSMRFDLAKRLSGKFSKLWVGAEVLLFVLVGASIDITYAISAGGAAILVIFGVVLCRLIGVFVSLIGSKLSSKERLFCMITYIPKGTVQAAIGAIPLTMGLACGNIVLTVAVLSILITAPLGAFIIDHSYKKLLSKEI